MCARTYVYGSICTCVYKYILYVTIWWYSVNTYTHSYSFIKVPGAPCCSLGLVASCALLFIWTSWGWGSCLLLSDHRVVEEDTGISTLRVFASGLHPYVMTYLTPECYLLEPKILVCGDTGLIQLRLPLPNDFLCLLC